MLEVHTQTYTNLVLTKLRMCFLFLYAYKNILIDFKLKLQLLN